MINLRGRRTSNLPIRGTSREWAKTLFSVPSESLWCDNSRRCICENDHYGIVMPDLDPAVSSLMHFSHNRRPSNASWIVDVRFFT